MPGRMSAPFFWRPLDRRTRVKAALAHLGLVWMLVITATRVSVAGQAPAPVLRAAFVHNFAKFTSWPPDVVAPGAPLVFCVSGDPEVAESLEALVKGRELAGHALAVREIDVDSGSIRACQLLYTSGLDAKRTTDLLQMVGHSAVLTVSDSEDFARRGGVASVFEADGKMRFAFNLEAVQRARLTVSSKLLTLGRIVKG